MSKPLLVIGNKNYSSWSLRGWLMLKLAGIDFTELRIPLRTAGCRDEIRKHNPAGKVPALKIGAQVIWDSLAIGEYLAEQYSKAWPEDREARALARSVSAEMHSSFPALRESLPMNCRARGRSVSLSQETSRDIARIQEIWRTCRSRHARGGPWLFGEYSIADAMYAPVALRFVTYGIPVGDVEQHYIETVLTLPSMKDWLRDAQAETEVIELYEVGK
jgi:glutathione S-transferase